MKCLCHCRARLMWNSSTFLPLTHHPSVPAEHQRRLSWPRRTTAAPARSGRGWPACATSTPKPASRQRMCPGCDPSSSPSNRRRWSAREGEREHAPPESLPWNVDLTPDPDVPSETCPLPDTPPWLYTLTHHYDTFNMRKYCYCKCVTPTSCYVIFRST